jgi:hypothetical protein
MGKEFWIKIAFLGIPIIAMFLVWLYFTIDIFLMRRNENEMIKRGKKNDSNQSG